MSRDDALVLDIVNAARLVKEFVGDLDKEAFCKDLKTQSSVLHQLLLIGEAVKRLSESYRNANPDVPWKRIAGMRDVLIHQYEEVDLEEVWKTVSVEMPALCSQLERLAPRKH